MLCDPVDELSPVIDIPIGEHHAQPVEELTMSMSKTMVGLAVTAGFIALLQPGDAARAQTTIAPAIGSGAAGASGRSGQAGPPPAGSTRGRRDLTGFSIDGEGPTPNNGLRHSPGDATERGGK